MNRPINMRPMPEGICDLFNVRPADVEQFIIIIKTPAGTFSVHTLCCEQHFRELMHSIGDAPMTDSHRGGN